MSSVQKLDLQHSWYFSISPMSLLSHFYNPASGELEQHPLSTDFGLISRVGITLEDVRLLLLSFYAEAESRTLPSGSTYWRIFPKDGWNALDVQLIVLFSDSETGQMGKRSFLEMLPEAIAEAQARNQSAEDHDAARDVPPNYVAALSIFLDSIELAPDHWCYGRFFAMKLRLVSLSNVTQFLAVNLINSFGGKFYEFKYFLMAQLVANEVTKALFFRDHLELVLAWLIHYQVHTIKDGAGPIALVVTNQLTAEVFDALKCEFLEDDQLRLIELLVRKKTSAPIFCRNSARHLVSLFKLLSDGGLFTTPDLKKFIANNFYFYDKRKQQVVRASLQTVKTYLAQPKYFQTHPVKSLVSAKKRS